MAEIALLAMGAGGALGGAATGALGAVTAGGIGSALIGGAQILSGIAGYQQAQFQSAVARANAQAARQQAEAEEVRLRREFVRRQAATRAAFGAAGVGLAGTPLDVLAEQAMIAEEDALLVRYGGRMQAREARLEASLFGRQATGSLLGGFASGLGTVLTAPTRPPPFVAQYGREGYGTGLAGYGPGPFGR